MQDSPDGRINVSRLQDDVDQGKIPGLVIRDVPTDKIADQVEEGKKAVIALVPYFYAHAFLVLDVNSEKGTYKAMDTVTGMVVEEELAPVPAEKPQTAAVEDTSKPSSDGGISDAEIEKIFHKIKELDFSRINDPPLFFCRPLHISGPYVPSPTQFITVEFTDPQAFVRWIKN